jgi:hypothetical protein
MAWCLVKAQGQLYLTFTLVELTSVSILLSSFVPPSSSKFSIFLENMGLIATGQMELPTAFEQARMMASSKVHSLTSSLSKHFFFRFTLLLTAEPVSNVSAFRSVHYEGVSKSFRTGRLERELQMVQLYATICNCIAIL